MTAHKGYLTHAWNLVGALLNNPKQAISDIGRSMGMEIDAVEGKSVLSAPNLLTYGGAAMALTGVLAPGLWPLAVAGVGISTAGLGAYRAEGAADRLEESRAAVSSRWPDLKNTIYKSDENTAGINIPAPVKQDRPGPTVH